MEEEGNLGKLVGCLLPGDAVDNKAALGVIHQTEALIGLLDLDDIHEARRVSRVCAHLLNANRALTFQLILLQHLR